MLIKRMVMIVSGLALGLASTATTAVATPQDVASTHAYIRADYALARASDAEVAPAEARILALNRKLAGECPDVGAGSPQTEASQPVSHEVVVALWSISYGSVAGPIRAFGATVKQLRWSNPKLTRIARSYATDLQELAKLPVPHICSDVRAWKATDFKTIPADTLSLVNYAEAIQPQTVPSRLLAPYELPTDKSALAQTRRLEDKLEELEIGVGLTDWDTMLATLGLNQ